MSQFSRRSKFFGILITIIGWVTLLYFQETYTAILGIGKSTPMTTITRGSDSLEEKIIGQKQVTVKSRKGEVTQTVDMKAILQKQSIYNDNNQQVFIIEHSFSSSQTSIPEIMTKTVRVIVAIPYDLISTTSGRSCLKNPNQKIIKTYTFLVLNTNPKIMMIINIRLRGLYKSMIM